METMLWGDLKPAPAYESVEQTAFLPLLGDILQIESATVLPAAQPADWFCPAPTEAVPLVPGEKPTVLVRNPHDREFLARILKGLREL